MRVRRRSIPFLVAALTIFGLFTNAPDATAAGKKSPMIVVLDRDTDVDAAVKRDKGKHGVKPTNVFKHAARGYAADLTPGQARAIERERSVMGVIPDTVVELVAQVTPPGVRRVRATSSPLTHINGVDLASHRVNADVAIIDTGIQPNHPDLRVVGGYDCTRPGTRSERSQSSRWRDDHGHGTHVAGIVGALDNTRGVVGVAPGVRLWAVRVFTATGYSRISWIACGIDWVTSKRDPNDSARPLIEVANMSLRDKGTDDRNCGYSVIDIEHQAICRSTARGTLYVVAAGNEFERGRELAPGVVQRGRHGVGDGRLRRQARRTRERPMRRVRSARQRRHVRRFQQLRARRRRRGPRRLRPARRTAAAPTRRYPGRPWRPRTWPEPRPCSSSRIPAHRRPTCARPFARPGPSTGEPGAIATARSIRCSTCPRSGRVPACDCARPRPRSGCEAGRAAAAVKLRLTRLDGFADTSTLSAESLPDGVTATFSKATFSKWQFGETTLTLRAAADAALGDADIVIVATAGSIRGSQKLHVHVID